MTHKSEVGNNDGKGLMLIGAAGRHDEGGHRAHCATEVLRLYCPHRLDCVCRAVASELWPTNLVSITLGGGD